MLELLPDECAGHCLSTQARTPLFGLCAGFRTPAWDAIHALRRPASEKRQGRKSREVGHWRCRGCYGDLAAGFGLMRLDRAVAAIGFLQSQCEHVG